MKTDLVHAGLVSLIVLALFFLAERMRRVFGLPTESTRKLVHAAVGTVIAPLPWMVESPWVVVALSVAFLGMLTATRVTGHLQSVHEVGRPTWGAWLYPLAVAGVFWWTAGRPAMFAISILILAWADAAAALAGRKWGRVRFPVLDAERTLVGSASFFLVAYLVALIGLAVAGLAGGSKLVLAALALAGVTTLVEAFSVRGTDNLLVPVAAAWLLGHTGSPSGGEHDAVLLAVVALVLAGAIVAGLHAPGAEGAAGLRTVRRVRSLRYARPSARPARNSSQ